MFLADMACAVALAERGVAAQGAAGFSLGEIPAACFVGLMDAAQAFGFVCQRAKAMQECSERHGGGMFALLGLSAGQVEGICARLPQAYPANYNCPGQTVVACADAAADALKQAASDQGGKAVKLAVSGAFHSPYMDAAGESIAAYLEEMAFGETQIPLYANATARTYGDPRELLAQQVNHPVLWQKTIENMVADGFDTFIELGPGKTLAGLIKKIDAGARACSVSDMESLENAVKYATENP
jgi:[acyl-carrier-protein] S-malonyltransferase